MLLEANLIEIHLPTPLLLWTGEGDLEFDGRTWQKAVRLIDIDQATLNVGFEAEPLNVSLSVESPELRVLALRENGVGSEITIRWISSVDGGNNWIESDFKMRGRVSEPSISGAVFRCKVERRFVNITKNIVSYWSAESQKAVDPTDRAAESMSAIASGVEIRWPP